MKIKGIVNAGIKEDHVTYVCIKCGQEKTIVLGRPNSTRATENLFHTAIDEQLCLCCLTGTDSRIEGAAENIEAMFCH